MIHEEESEQPRVEMSMLAEIYADDHGLFDDDSGDGESINWHYCMEHATFSHKEACEFILHIGDPQERDVSCDEATDTLQAYWQGAVKEMRAYGCTEDFIDAYVAAKDNGAVRVLFYA